MCGRHAIPRSALHGFLPPIVWSARGAADDGAAALFRDAQPSIVVETVAGVRRIALEAVFGEPVACSLRLDGAAVFGTRPATVAAQPMEFATLEHEVALDGLVNVGAEYAAELVALRPDGEVAEAGRYTFVVPAEDGEVLLTEAAGWLAGPVSAALSAEIAVAVGEVTASRVEAVATTPAELAGISTWRVHRSDRSRTDGVWIRHTHTRAATEHFLRITGLEPDTEYSIFLVVTTGEGLEESFVTTVRTLSGGGGGTGAVFGANVALESAGGSVAGVSSNWAGGSLDSSFGGNKAIDGSAFSAWSSNGDGDDAWIEVAFERTLVGGVGFWSRQMSDGSSITTRFRAQDTDGRVLGEWDLPSPDELFRFDLTRPQHLDRVRFAVVASSGGNTGAVEVEVYRAVLALDVACTAGGALAITATGGTPGGGLILAMADGPGGLVVDSVGACSEVAVGLAAPIRMSMQRSFDADGSFEFGATLDEEHARVCASAFAVFDVATCAVANWEP